MRVRKRFRCYWFLVCCRSFMQTGHTRKFREFASNRDPMTSPSSPNLESLFVWAFSGTQARLHFDSLSMVAERGPMYTNRS